MVYYILFICLIKLVGDYVYDDPFDHNWFKYLILLIASSGVFLYATY